MIQMSPILHREYPAPDDGTCGLGMSVLHRLRVQLLIDETAVVGGGTGGDDASCLAKLHDNHRSCTVLAKFTQVELGKARPFVTSRN